MSTSSSSTSEGRLLTPPPSDGDEMAGGPTGMTDAFPQQVLSRYLIIRQIGRGGSGTVWLGRRPDGFAVAIKVIVKSQIPLHRLVYDRDPGSGATLLVPMEVYMLRRIRHPNVAALIDYGEDSLNYYVVTEHFGHEWTPDGSTDLFGCIESRGRLSEEQAMSVFSQLVHTIAFLQNINVYHLDIKDENIAVDQQFRIKLLDFGSAIVMPRPSSGQLLLTRFFGTFRYAPPEVVKGIAYTPELAEVWCLGIVLYMMLHGVPPYRVPADSANPEHYPPLRSDLSLSMNTLIVALLSKDPICRPKVSRLLPLLKT